MSDIQPGDVVVCINAKPDRIDPKAALLAEGRTYRVAVVGDPGNGVHCVAFRCLRSDEPNKGYAWNAARFRKIRPADPEFIELVKRVRAPLEPVS